MVDTIGLLEFKRIASGIEAANQMIKAADIELLNARYICPGKYIVLIAGDVSAVKSSINAGLNIGKKDVIKELTIPKVSKQLIDLIQHKKSKPENFVALGVLEYSSIAAGIIAADAAVKAAEVELVKIVLGMTTGGKSLIIFTGSIEACKQGLNAAESANKDNQKYLLGKKLISSPEKPLLDSLI
ncbi:MAG: BMC domain-containing protein [Bacillota bacterium]